MLGDIVQELHTCCSLGLLQSNIVGKCFARECWLAKNGCFLVSGRHFLTVSFLWIVLLITFAKGNFKEKASFLCSMLAQRYFVNKSTTLIYYLALKLTGEIPEGGQLQQSDVLVFSLQHINLIYQMSLFLASNV